jgi:hypothetical protein
MAASYYFFTDANQQATGLTQFIDLQLAEKAYGPVMAGAAAGMDEYRVTSLHTASFEPTAYAACDAIVCVQRIPSTGLTGLGITVPLVNVILKPRVQPALNFAPVKYIIYKGILESSLINTTAPTEVAPAATNDLTKAVWEAQATKDKKTGATTATKAPAKALGVDLDASFTDSGVTPFTDNDPLDNLFFRTGVLFQLPIVKGGWSIGKFNKTSFGMEVLMDGLGFQHTLALARVLEHKISVPELTSSENAQQLFDHWHAKEQVLGYMDPCAFYGSFFRVGVQAKSSGNVPFTNRAGNALYNDLLFAFHNKGISYLDIRNEHGFSFNYFTNYGTHIQLSCDPANVQPAPTDYYASCWPILTLPKSGFPAGNTTMARNAFRIQLPVGDNPQPLLYVSQGYRDINRKRKGFPEELKSAERFYDSFEPPAGGFTATLNKSGHSSMTFVVPNVTGQSAVTPVSCYVRLKYLKQQQGATNAPTVIKSSNHLDNLFYPLDLRVLFAGSASIKSFVYDEEVYASVQDSAGQGFDFIGQVGIARDAANTSFFLMPSIVRAKEGQASRLVTLSGETSDFAGDYPRFVALKSPLERVIKSDLVFSATNHVPVATFYSDGDEAARENFNVPDFDKFFMFVVANATYDSWKSKVTAAGSALDGRFRVYLGMKNWQTQADSTGVEYTSFELVLRGYELDANAGHYKVREMNTDPTSNTTNVKVYAYAGD